MKKIILILVTLVSVVFLGAVARGLLFIYTPSSEVSNEIIFNVKPGRSFYGVTKDLVGQGLISHELIFKVYGRLKNSSTNVRSGEYALNTNQTPSEILDILTSGGSIQYALTFQEGINMYEMAELIQQNGFGSAKEFIRLCHDKNFVRSLLGEDIYSLEGYLFPETYNLTKFTGSKALIKLMVKNFLIAYGEASSGAQLNIPRHRTVTLASIIEKETGAPQERQMISSVFHNRLKKNMRLQSDPTILYGIMDITGKMQKNISRKDIHAPTKYNTYTVKALPFGPISNPGKEALRATLNPVQSNYLYFVSRNDGTHYFSTTYKEHLNAVRKFQLNRKMREGKSWRDLNKKKSQK